jgi:hypothetical protein
LQTFGAALNSNETHLPQACGRTCARQHVLAIDQDACLPSQPGSIATQGDRLIENTLDITSDLIGNGDGCPACFPWMG